MGDGRRWRCRRRRSRPVCLTRSATVNGNGGGSKYLCSTIAWDRSSGIVPQALVRSSDWLLVVMVGVSCGKCGKGKEAQGIEQHDGSSMSKLIDLDSRYISLCSIKSKTAGGKQRKASTETKTGQGNFTRPRGHSVGR